MRPNYHSEGLYDENKMRIESKQRENIHQPWHVNGVCPEDTIYPIRRTKEEDVLRAISVKTHGKKHNSFPVFISIPKYTNSYTDNESGRQVMNIFD